MSVQNSTVLKSYLETGDKPSQQQFGDLIDSLQEARDNAITALTTAVSAQVVSTSALSSANNRVLRAGDTMTGALIIDGSADTEQLVLIGHTSQTDPILLIEDSAALSLLTVGNTGNLTAVGNFILGPVGAVARFKVPTSGVITLTDNGDTSFGRLQLGGTTASFPALKRNTTGIDVRLADDSAFAPLGAGSFLLTQGTITTDLKNLESVVTWNNSGVTFTAWKLEVTSTASAAASLLLDLREGGFTKLNVDKFGSVVLKGNLTVDGGTLSFNETGLINFYPSRSTIRSPADGQFTFSNSAGTDFSRLNFGGASSSFPALRRAGSGLDLVSADNTVFTNFQAGIITSNARMVVTQGTITTDLKNLEGTVTWNAGGVTFAGWKLNVTNTASETASALLDLQVGSVSKFFVGLTGNLLITAGTITTNIQQLSTAATWNAGGVDFTSWKLNVVDTASAAGSKLLDLQVGGTPKFAINKGGVLLIGFTLPAVAASFEGGIQFANAIAPSADPNEGVAIWADGTTDEWFYRTAAGSEGAGDRFRVHNRLESATGSGTNYTLTGSTARVDFGTGDAEVEIPTAGTYLIEATIQFVGDAVLGAGDELHVKIRNATDAVDVGFESVETMPTAGGFITTVLERRHVNVLGTTQTIQIFSHNATAARGTVTSTQTSLKFTRLY